MSLSNDELERFADALAAAPERWRHLVRHDDTRVYEQIWDDEDVNAWLICWSEDSDTGFHDHDDSAAGITVVSGSVREDRLTLGGVGGANSRELGAGTTFTVPPTAIHRVLHAGEGPAVTIHAYSPPLRRMGAYRVGAHGELERESQPFERELGAGLALA
jgi:mannose-6-phosphate isomerase-like protein (cupin superfamily)